MLLEYYCAGQQLFLLYYIPEYISIHIWCQVVPTEDLCTLDLRWDTDALATAYYAWWADCSIDYSVVKRPPQKIVQIMSQGRSVPVPKLLGIMPSWSSCGNVTIPRISPPSVLAIF